MEFEEKKKLISKYCVLKHEINTILDKLEELQTTTLRSLYYSTKVSGGALNSVVENSVERVEYLKNQLSEKIRLSKELFFILDTIFKQLEPAQHEIMVYRFINCYKWSKIAEKTGKSYRYVVKLCSKVIASLPEEMLLKIKGVIK